MEQMQPQGYSQEQQQMQFSGQQTYPGGSMQPAGVAGTSGTMLPDGQFVPNGGMVVMPNGQMMPSPGAMNMGTPGAAAFQQSGMPGPAFSTGGQLHASSPGGGFGRGGRGQGFLGRGGGDGEGFVDAIHHAGPPAAPIMTLEQERVVGVPPGMTRESMQPGYDPRLTKQRRVFDPTYSFKDSFGNSRANHCCTIS